MKYRGGPTIGKPSIALGALGIPAGPKRRRAASLMLNALERAQAEEGACLNRIPFNMHGGKARAAADDSPYCLYNAIATLLEAY